MNQQNLQQLAKEIGLQLIEHDMRMATAESCTGGWISKIITDLEGSSQWFECSLVTYSNQAKMDLLAVTAKTLNDYGAVSEQTVKAMVLGLLSRCRADIGVSISGIAGPGGGTKDKPVGTVWIAWGLSEEITECLCFDFKGDREQVRMQAVHESLLGVQRILSKL